MGARQDSRGTTFVRQVGGTLCIRLKGPGKHTWNDGTEMVSEERRLKDGEIVHEVNFKSFAGYIYGIVSRSGDYGRELLVHMADETDRITLSLFMYKGGGRDLINRLANADLSRRLEVSAYSRKNDNNEHSTSFLLVNYDDGGKEKVGRYSTQDKPNGIPAPVKSEDQEGKEIYIYKDMMNALAQIVAENLKKADMSLEKIERLKSGSIASSMPEHARPGSAASVPKHGEDVRQQAADTQSGGSWVDPFDDGENFKPVDIDLSGDDDDLPF